MKKVIFLSLVSLLILPVIALAQIQGAPTLDMWDAIDDITDAVFTFLLIAAAIAIIIAAYFFVTASGDTEKVKTARNFVLYAVIGVVIALVAKGLVIGICSLLGVSC